MLNMFGHWTSTLANKTRYHEHHDDITCTDSCLIHILWLFHCTLLFKLFKRIKRKLSAAMGCTCGVQQSVVFITKPVLAGPPPFGLTLFGLGGLWDDIYIYMCTSARGRNIMKNKFFMISSSLQSKECIQSHSLKEGGFRWHPNATASQAYHFA